MSEQPTTPVKDFHRIPPEHHTPVMDILRNSDLIESEIKALNLKLAYYAEQREKEKTRLENFLKYHVLPEEDQDCQIVVNPDDLTVIVYQNE